MQPKCTKIFLQGGQEIPKWNGECANNYITIYEKKFTDFWQPERLKVKEFV